MKSVSYNLANILTLVRILSENNENKWAVRYRFS
jgi:hypothetical protein